MAITLVQSTGASVAAFGASTTVALTVSAGNALVCFVSVWAGTAQPTVSFSDNKGNTWAVGAQGSNTGAGEKQNAAIGAALNIASGATTVTVSVAGGALNYAEITLAEVSGLLSAGAIDASATNSGSSTSPTSGTSGSIAQTDEIGVGCLVMDVGTASGIDLPTGYTNLRLSQTNATTINASHDYKITLSAGTQNVSWGTTTPSGPWAACMCTLKSPATAGIPLQSLYVLNAVNIGANI